MTFDTTKPEPIAPKGLSGRFVNIGEFIERDDLMSYTPDKYGKDGNWKKCLVLAEGMKLKLGCLATFFRPSVPYDTDKMGYYTVPTTYAKKAIELYSRVPKGLSGRFLEKDEIVKPNDLMDYGSWEAGKSRWKKVCSDGYKVYTDNYYYRPYQKYLTDVYGMYLSPSPDKTFYLDGIPEPVKKIVNVKKISHPALAHNKYS